MIAPETALNTDAWMAATLGELRDLLAHYGMPTEVVGDAEQRVTRVATLDDAVAGDVTFLSNPKYEKKLQDTKASAVVVRPEIPAPPRLNLLRTADPYAAITVLIVKLHGYRRHPQVPPTAGVANIHPTARIGEHATIHPGVTVAEDVVIGDHAVIYPGCYVGPRCRIGDRVLLYPNVVIYDDCVLGHRVTIHANTTIGEDGLGYAPYQGQWVKIPQVGHVEIQDDVEIGANCAIDRATLGKTVIGRGTKFSNLIAIGHGTRIGEHCMFVAQTGLAGSVNCGSHVTLAGQAGVVGHIRIGDGAKIGAKAGVVNDVADGETVLGQPAIPIAEHKRSIVYVARLPDMSRKLRRLEQRVAELEARLGDQPSA